MNQEVFICEKLRKLGYRQERHIRLYGEEFDLTSNPIADGNGFSVDGIAKRSGDHRRIRVPMSLVGTIRRELSILEDKIVFENKIAA